MAKRRGSHATQLKDALKKPKPRATPRRRRTSIKDLLPPPLTLVPPLPPVMNTSFVASNQYRYLRACMVCSIVQSQQKFSTQGCPNCEEFLHLQGSSETISECTSQVFEGLITLADPGASWVAKWQRLDSYVPGVYAVKVSGILQEEVIQNVEDAGVKYIPRDGSAADDDAAA